MRKIFPSLIACLALLTVALTASAADWQGAASVGLEVSGAKGRNLAGARVTLTYRGAQGGGPESRLTDSKGRAAFTGLAPGSWTVEVSHPGHLSYVAALTVRQGKKAEPMASFLQATGEGRESMRVRFFKAGSPVGSPAPPAPAEPPVAKQAEEPAQPAPAAERPAPATPPAPAAQPIEPPAGEPTIEPTIESTPASEPEPATPAPSPAVEPSPPSQPAAESPAPPQPETPAPAPEPARPEAASEPAPGTEPPAPRPQAPPQPAAEPTPETPPPAPEPLQEPPAAPVQKPAQPAEPSPPAEAEPAPAATAEPPTPAVVEPAPPAEPKGLPEPESAPAPPTSAPAPAPSVPPPPAPVPPPVLVAAPELRSFSNRSCPECKPGEWAASAEVVVAGGDGSCADAAELRNALRTLASASGNGLDRFAGQAMGSVRPTALERLDAAERGPLSDRLAELDQGDPGCRVAAVALPVRARFVGFRFQAGDGGALTDCQAEAACPAAGAAWVANPMIVRGSSLTVIYALYQNRSAGVSRTARLTAYFEPPPGGWQGR